MLNDTFKIVYVSTDTNKFIQKINLVSADLKIVKNVKFKNPIVVFKSTEKKKFLAKSVSDKIILPTTNLITILNTCTFI